MKIICFDSTLFLSLISDMSDCQVHLQIEIQNWLGFIYSQDDVQIEFDVIAVASC
jgi:hypothetical protein